MTFLQQLPALLGVMIGAAGSYLAVSSNERARFRRDQAVRWDQRRMDAYADYSRAVQATVTLLWRVAAHRGIDPYPEPLAPAQASPLLAAAWAERDIAWEVLRLLGSAQVVAAAREWHAKVSVLQGYATGQTTAGADGWQTAMAASRQTRQQYYDLARQDLTVRGG